MAETIPATRERPVTFWRFTLGNATIATRFDIQEDIPVVEIVAGASALRVSHRGNDGAALTEHYMDLPANTNYPIAATPDDPDVGHMQSIYVAGDTGNNASVAIVVKNGEEGN